MGRRDKRNRCVYKFESRAAVSPGNPLVSKSLSVASCEKIKHGLCEYERLIRRGRLPPGELSLIVPRSQERCRTGVTKTSAYSLYLIDITSPLNYISVPYHDYPFSSRIYPRNNVPAYVRLISAVRVSHGTHVVISGDIGLIGLAVMVRDRDQVAYEKYLKSIS